MSWQAFLSSLESAGAQRWPTTVGPGEGQGPLKSSVACLPFHRRGPKLGASSHWLPTTVARGASAAVGFLANTPKCCGRKMWSVGRDRLQQGLDKGCFMRTAAVSAGPPPKAEPKKVSLNGKHTQNKVAY